jgi:hypothetical protein
MFQVIQTRVEIITETWIIWEYLHYALVALSWFL